MFQVGALREFPPLSALEAFQTFCSHVELMGGRRHQTQTLVSLYWEAHICYTVKPLARKNDVILIDGEYDSKYLKRVRLLQKVFRVSSIAIGRISEPAIEKAYKLSKAFRKAKHYDVMDPQQIIGIASLR